MPARLHPATVVLVLLLGRGDAQISGATTVMVTPESDGVVDGIFMFSAAYSTRADGCCRGAEPMLAAFTNVARKHDCRRLCVGDSRCHTCKGPSMIPQARPPMSMFNSNHCKRSIASLIASVASVASQA